MMEQCGVHTQRQGRKLFPPLIRAMSLAIVLLFAQQLISDDQSGVPAAVARDIIKPYSSYYTRLVHEPRFESRRLLILMKYYSVISSTSPEELRQKFPRRMLNELLIGLRKERNNLMLHEQQIKRFYPKNQVPVSVRRSLSFYSFTIERAIRDVARRLHFYDTTTKE